MGNGTPERRRPYVAPEWGGAEAGWRPQAASASGAASGMDSAADRPDSLMLGRDETGAADVVVVLAWGGGDVKT